VDWNPEAPDQTRSLRASLQGLREELSWLLGGYCLYSGNPTFFTCENFAGPTIQKHFVIILWLRGAGHEKGSAHALV